ncbi:MAG: hypothetical protein JWQ23_2356 [Herminiimonas sp.]|nr:hypothetical protein [Herminiimonas sp.]
MDRFLALQPLRVCRLRHPNLIGITVYQSWRELAKFDGFWPVNTMESQVGKSFGGDGITSIPALTAICLENDVGKDKP